MPRAVPLLLLALLVSACGTARTAAPDPEAPSDVRLDGVSILGAWRAVGAPDDAQADADLRAGVLERTLVVNPRRYVTLTGIDRRVSEERVTYRGRLSGRSLRFDDLDGTATLRIQGTRLVLTDPGGRRTVYRRSR